MMPSMKRKFINNVGESAESASFHVSCNQGHILAGACSPLVLHLCMHYNVPVTQAHAIKMWEEEGLVTSDIMWKIFVSA